MRQFLYPFLAAALVSSAGCDGSSNGGPDAFTTWSALSPSSTVRIEGIGRVVQYDSDSSGDVSTGTPEDVDVNVDWGVDAAGNLNALSVETDPADPFGGGFASVSTSVEFDVGAGDTIIDGLGFTPAASDFLVAVTSGGDQFAAFADPAAQGFEHQTFGMWANGLNAGTGVFGAASVGSVTPGSGVPTSGTATYNGSATGAYVDATGTDFFTFADFSASADFGLANSLIVATTNTTAVNVTTSAASSMPSLNFAGVGGANQPFSINIVNTGPTLAGTLDGQFYGPNAEELGGTFLMTGSAGQYMGSVGAVR